MATHREFEIDPDEAQHRPRPRRSDQAPLDATWIENEGLRALRRHEKSRAGLTQNLQSAIEKRCLRTGENGDAALELIPDVLDALEARRFLDDRRYATALFERYEAKGDARHRIGAKLAQKGFSEALIEELVRSGGPEADRRAAWRTAKRKRLGPFCPDPDQRERERERHLGALARGGFSRDVAHEIVDAKEPPPSDFFTVDPDDAACT